jgi:hypothetical protein
MIRTAVDVLLALGIVTATRYASATSITWDHRQEQALKSTADATAEYQQLMTDIGNLEKEAALLSEELQRIELNPMSSPREPPAYAVRFQE